ncbi:hypothetical protein SYNPS1DRAFT_28478 [Syncephalis pseudoplumigaleata]|uniref:F-box domain-containing protein n=1 Tax=Syncephalis pseudoplumigaleata TaxID=1712513 RepID=A0A4P9Z211_9FUNG|nr:hypothetical protein SYNPS1DRAFT_28478 [Syncephalis pseudoplumigaleata]|eukprot:RKP25801.1 hypothetical protein SYNPS1DRAFT_28478 [Syncephalis pseudoplumigaleata]
MDSASRPTTATATTAALVDGRRLDYLERLPTELVANLLQLAGPQACVRVACASRRLWQIGVTHPALWRSLYTSCFPLDDKEIEWIEWCSSILSLEENEEAEEEEDGSGLPPCAGAAPSPIYIRTSNPVSSPPPVLRGVLVRWFRLFGRRVCTDRNWHQMSFQPSTLPFPGTFSKAAWHELHIWKSCLANTIFFLDAHVHPASNSNNNNNNKDDDNDDEANEFYDEFYDSCHSSENEDESAHAGGDAYTNSNAASNNSRHDEHHAHALSQLYLLRHRPGATVRELRLGPAHSRLSLRRAPIARINSQYVVVDGDAVVRTPSTSTAKSAATAHRPTVERCIWIWRVDNTEPILTLCGNQPGRRPSAAHASSSQSQLVFTDLMGHWLLCRRQQASGDGALTDYVMYDLARCTAPPTSTADEGVLACLGVNASTAHFQRVSEEAAAIDRYGRVNRAHTRGSSTAASMSVYVYSHAYLDDSAALNNTVAATAKGTGQCRSRSLAWRVDAVCYGGGGSGASVKCATSGICRHAVAADIAESGPLLASRIDDDRVLLQVQSFIMDTVWLAVLSTTADGGILWQQRGSFFRPELYTGHGFIAVNSTRADDDTATGSRNDAYVPSSCGKSTAPHASDHSDDTHVYHCDHATCNRLISGNGHALMGEPSPPTSTREERRNDVLPAAASFSKTIVLSTNNSSDVAGGKKHAAESNELADTGHEQRQSFVRLLCLAHGQPIRPPMLFTGFCRTIRIIGAIGLTTPASSAEWYFCVTDIAEGRPLSRLDFIQRGRNLKGQICSTYSVMVDEDRPGYCWVFNFSEPSLQQHTTTATIGS